MEFLLLFGINQGQPFNNGAHGSAKNKGIYSNKKIFIGTHHV